MANDYNRRPTLYTGVTSHLIKRVHEHKNKLMPSFTAKYNCNKLVYYEVLDTIEQAIIREKQIKHLGREDKLRLIKGFNPTMKDLYSEILSSTLRDRAPQAQTRTRSHFIPQNDERV